MDVLSTILRKTMQGVSVTTYEWLDGYTTCMTTTGQIAGFNTFVSVVPTEIMYALNTNTAISEIQKRVTSTAKPCRLVNMYYITQWPKLSNLDTLGQSFLNEMIAIKSAKSVQIRHKEMIAFLSCARYAESVVSWLPTELHMYIWKYLNRDRLITNEETQAMVSTVFQTFGIKGVL